jgi:hypothetical protein
MRRIAELEMAPTFARASGSYVLIERPPLALKDCLPR